MGEEKPEEREGRVIRPAKGSYEEATQRALNEIANREPDDHLFEDVPPGTLSAIVEKEPYHHETQPAFGEHSAWQEWYIEHSQCGGTWVYVKQTRRNPPYVMCSCSMGMN